MTHYEKLRENYEDAVFYLLMDQLAKERGDTYQALNEQLKSDPTFVVPPAVSRACYRRVDRACAQIRRAEAGRAAGKLFRRAAILIAVLTLLLTAALAVSPELRAHTLNLVIEAFDTHANLYFVSSEQEAALDVLEPDWLPDGYSCTYQSDDSTLWEFENEEGHWILLVITSDNAGIDLDTENASVMETVSVNGHQGLYVERPADNSLIWGDPDQGKVLSLHSDDLDRATIQSVAEHLSLK